MPYDPQLEQTVILGKPYKEAAKDAAKQDKRTLRGHIEHLIEQDAKKKKISISY